MKKIFTIIAVVAALQLFLVSATYAAPSSWGNDGGAYHTVRYGETLYSIGRTYGVHPNKIAKANGLYNPNYIYAGQVLYIPQGQGGYPPGGGHPPGGGQPGGQYHKVRWGETLYSIGRMYGVNPHCISQANGLYNPNYIYAGQVLYIPTNCGGYNPGWGNKPGHKPVPCQYDNCYGNVDPGWGVPKPEQPIYDECQYHCNNSGTSYYGYDYTGYYYVGYYPQQKQYSYTCGYYHNCW